MEGKVYIIERGLVEPITVTAVDGGVELEMPDGAVLTPSEAKRTGDALFLSADAALKAEEEREDSAPASSQ